MHPNEPPKIPTAEQRTLRNIYATVLVFMLGLFTNDNHKLQKYLKEPIPLKRKLLLRGSWYEFLMRLRSTLRKVGFIGRWKCIICIIIVCFDFSPISSWVVVKSGQARWSHRLHAQNFRLARMGSGARQIRKWGEMEESLGEPSYPVFAFSQGATWRRTVQRNGQSLHL